MKLWSKFSGHAATVLDLSSSRGTGAAERLFGGEGEDELDII
jgi:hypothetical protein